MTAAPNAILRGGTLDGVQARLSRGGRVSTYRPGTGEEYRATDFWEGDLRVYRLVSPEPGSPTQAGETPSG